MAEWLGREAAVGRRGRRGRRGADRHVLDRAGFGQRVPFACGHEVLLVYGPMTASAAARTVVFRYAGRPGGGPLAAVRRAGEAGRIAPEEHAPLEFVARLEALLLPAHRRSSASLAPWRAHPACALGHDARDSASYREGDEIARGPGRTRGTRHAFRTGPTSSPQPAVVIDLGLPGLDDEGLIRLRAVHPGVTVRDVAPAGGRPVRLQPRVEKTLAPPPPAGRAVAAARRAAGATRERDREGGRT